MWGRLYISSGCENISTMNMKRHWKLMSVIVAIVIAASSTLVVLAQPVTVKYQGPEAYDVPVSYNGSYINEVFIYTFNSSNATFMSGLVNGSMPGNKGPFSVDPLNVYVLNMEQLYNWTEESNNASLRDLAYTIALHGGKYTMLTNVTPSYSI